MSLHVLVVCFINVFECVHFCCIVCFFVSLSVVLFFALGYFLCCFEIITSMQYVVGTFVQSFQ